MGLKAGEPIMSSTLFTIFFAFGLCLHTFRAIWSHRTPPIALSSPINAHLYHSLTESRECEDIRCLYAAKQLEIYSHRFLNLRLELNTWTFPSCLCLLFSYFPPNYTIFSSRTTPINRMKSPRPFQRRSGNHLYGSSGSCSCSSAATTSGGTIPLPKSQRVSFSRCSIGPFPTVHI